MQKNITFDQFKQLTADALGIDSAHLDRDMSLRDDLGIDSLSVINFIVKLERTFHIQIRTDHLWSIQNMEELYLAFQDCLQNNSASFILT